jgi:hypothetical protein
MYQLDFVCIPSFQHAIIADFGCSLLTSKPSYNGEKVITEFRANINDIVTVAAPEQNH